MSKIDKLLSSESWQASVLIIEDFLKSDTKLDSLLDRHAGGLKRDVNRRVQYLSYGVVRNLGRLQSALRSAVNKPPKKRLQAMLLLALFEWENANEGSRPQVVHYAVEQAKRRLSKAEGRFVNAVMRRIPELGIEQVDSERASGDWSVQFSHPQWIIDRWLKEFGKEETRKLLEWNQSQSKTYVWSPVSDSAIPEDWIHTDWPEFYDLSEADWTAVQGMLSDGQAYIQDPSTRVGPGLLTVHSVASVLDLCAAPGGKSIQLQRSLTEDGGLLVSVDLEGPRFKRLEENLARYARVGVQGIQIAGDVLSLKPTDLPEHEFDAVYLDVPCSNTGVIQRRPDVKWRQSESGMEELVALQRALLSKAAQFVKPEGFLVYSTCSIERVENEDVVERFLSESGGSFVLEAATRSLPWKTGHDGAGAALLRRIK